MSLIVSNETAAVSWIALVETKHSFSRRHERGIPGDKEVENAWEMLWFALKISSAQNAIWWGLNISYKFLSNFQHISVNS